MTVYLIIRNTVGIDPDSSSTTPGRTNRIPFRNTSPTTSSPRVKIGGGFNFQRPEPAGNGNERNEAIVESIHREPFAEDSDPETRCRNQCGVNENCQINADGGIDCKCRPGFGRKAPNLQCESE